MLPTEHLTSFLVDANAACDSSTGIECQINEQGKNLRGTVYHLPRQVAEREFLPQMVWAGGRSLEQLFGYIDLGYCFWDVQVEFLVGITMAGPLQSCNDRATLRSLMVTFN
jgi:hypothetical protein